MLKRILVLLLLGTLPMFAFTCGHGGGADNLEVIIIIVIFSTIINIVGLIKCIYSGNKFIVIPMIPMIIIFIVFGINPINFILSMPIMAIIMLIILTRSRLKDESKLSS
jgi:hypothetical protein